MGRGGYDTTDASAAKSSAAQTAVNQHHAGQDAAEVYSLVLLQDTLSGINTGVSDGQKSSRRWLITRN
jgi:hypothetical protein